MVRKTIYITDAQQAQLATLARITGKTRGRLVREAVEEMLKQFSAKRKAALERVCGMWKDRDDIPELFEQMRSELDRR